MAAALEGVKVCDFSWAIAGPVASKYLALHGAEVVKIETHVRLDGPRMAPPFAGKPHRNRSGYFAEHNAAKRSVAVQLAYIVDPARSLRGSAVRVLGGCGGPKFSWRVVSP